MGNRLFIDTRDLATIARAAKNMRMKRIEMTTAKERLDAWRAETLECVSFERWLAEGQKKPAAEGSAE